MITTIDKFPADVQKFLDDEPELLESIELYLEADQWSPDDPPVSIEYLIDDVIVADYDPSGGIDVKHDIPENYRTFEIQFNEEPVYLVANIDDSPHELINRLKNID